MQLQTRQGIPYQLDKDLDGGGEARIWTIQGQPHLLAKIYHKPTPQQEAKLGAMLANPPVQPPTHTAIAWPIERLYKQDKFVGFLMPYAQGNQKIFHLYNPALRKRSQHELTRVHLHRAALNLSIAAASVHAKGHVIGDVNESNILVNPQALVTLVDTDSFQVQSTDGQIYRCSVGKPEYTPPELQGIDFKTIDRSLTHDHFGLAVLIFQLLMEGYHPFAGVLTSQRSVGRVNLYCIKQGLFPYRRNTSVSSPPNAPLLTTLHPELQALFIRTFVEGHQSPERRPVAGEWQRGLEIAETALVTCQREPKHIYSNHLSRRPLCIRPKPKPKSKPKPKPKPKSTSPLPTQRPVQKKESLPPQITVPISHRKQPIHKQASTLSTRKQTTASPTSDSGSRYLLGLFLAVLLGIFVVIIGASTQLIPLPALFPAISAQFSDTENRVFSVGQLAQVQTRNGLNLRDEPDTAASLLYTLPQNTIVEILDGPIEAEGYRWWKVEDAEGRVGWSAEGDGESWWLGQVE